MCLQEYLAGCNQTIGCNSADFIGFESSGSSGVKLQWFTNGGSNGQLTASGGGVSPDAGTAMAVAPIPKIAKRNDSYPRVAMYLVEDDNLVELYGGTSLNWENNDLTGRWCSFQHSPSRSPVLAARSPDSGRVC